MQNKNMKNLLMAAVGAYLVYTGVTLILDVQKGQPENEMIFIICGSVFAILGLVTAVINLKTYISVMKEEFATTTSDEEEDAYEEFEDESVVSQPESRKTDTVIIDLAGAEELEPEVTEEEAEELEESDDSAESEEEGE